MSKIVKKINKEASNRHKEITYMFSKIESHTSPIDRYFYARTVVVFTYGTLEKYIKTLSEYALKVALENRYFNNNYIKELMGVLKYKNKPIDIFDLLMHHKGIFILKRSLDFDEDTGYFSRRGKIDSVAIAHIVNVLNLNKYQPNLKIPKMSIDLLAKKRMDLAHGDYLNDLNKFGPSRKNLNMNEVDDYIEEELKLNDTTRNEVLSFIEEFKEKIILFISDVQAL